MLQSKQDRKRPPVLSDQSLPSTNISCRTFQAAIHHHLDSSLVLPPAPPMGKFFQDLPALGLLLISSLNLLVAAL